MSSAPTLPERPAPASQRDEDAQYYRAVLHELIELGAGLARALHRDAALAPAPAPTAAQDLTVAFERIARTIRRTIALARKVTDPDPPSLAARAAEAAQQRRLAARKQIIREVEDTIQRQADGPESEEQAEARAEALNAELYERLDALDLDDDLDQLPVAEIIAAIRRDLGVAAHLPGTRPWRRRTPRDVRELCARAARPPAAARTAQPNAAPANAAPLNAVLPARAATGPPLP